MGYIVKDSDVIAVGREHVMPGDTVVSRLAVVVTRSDDGGIASASVVRLRHVAKGWKVPAVDYVTWVDDEFREDPSSITGLLGAIQAISRGEGQAWLDQRRPPDGWEADR